jgi:hypothetical protein
MKEVTLDNFTDYLEKSKAYDDPKVIKIYEVNKAVTFMRTWLLQYRGLLNEEQIKALIELGHRKGKMQDVVPLGRGI